MEDDLIEIDGYKFRNVKDGRALPAPSFADMQIQEWHADVLVWFCPSLTHAEALRLVSIGNGIVEIAVAPLRAFILRELPRLRRVVAFDETANVRPGDVDSIMAAWASDGGEFICRHYPGKGSP